MSFSKKSRLNKSRNIFIVLVVVSVVVYNYFQIDNVEIFIETDSVDEEIFAIYTSISYSAIEGYTKGGEMRMINSGSAQILPIKLDDVLFFSYFRAWVYHPDYIRQHKRKGNRTILRTARFPRFVPRSWRKEMTDKVKISRSSAPDGMRNYSEYMSAIETGDIIRIVDILGHLDLFKESYIPLFLKQGSKKQLRKYLPGLKKLVGYVKANVEIKYDQLDKKDREYIGLLDKRILELEEMLR